MRPIPRILPSFPRRRVVVPLQLSTLHPCADVVELLDNARERAVSGEFRAVGIAYVLRDRGLGTAWANGDADWRHLLACAGELQRRLGSGDA